ncbi:MAG: Gfo/Idh/MocA family oxidoreductase [Armatimonadota bacterium]|nr:Gfo/Idh/MocA family oxidoreductase [Armatimonadota bacterium]
MSGRELTASEVLTVRESRGFGVIGTGVWGETHLMTYSTHPDAELVCICDLNEELVRQRAEQYGAGRWTTDYQELLADESIDAVSVVTPDFLHREIAIAAAEAGKDVLLEKPMATTVGDCQAMIDAAEANDVTLMVDFHNRWNPAMWGIKEKIVSGEMGEPQMLTVRLNDTIFVPTQMLSWAGDSTVIWFLGSHAVDLVRWLFDDEVSRVYSVSRSEVLKARGIDTPDFFLTIAELEGGGVAHVETCWIMSEEMPTVFDFKLEMIGSEGTAFADASSHRMLQTFTPDEGGEYPDVAVVTDIQGVPNGFGVQSIRHFADCVIEGREPSVSPGDGLENTRVLVAIHESAESGRPVEIER